MNNMLVKDYCSCKNLVKSSTLIISSYFNIKLDSIITDLLIVNVLQLNRSQQSRFVAPRATICKKITSFSSTDIPSRFRELFNEVCSTSQSRKAKNVSNDIRRTSKQRRGCPEVKSSSTYTFPDNGLVRIRSLFWVACTAPAITKAIVLSKSSSESSFMLSVIPAFIVKRKDGQ